MYIVFLFLQKNEKIELRYKEIEKEHERQIAKKRTTERVQRQFTWKLLVINYGIFSNRFKWFRKNF